MDKYNNIYKSNTFIKQSGETMSQFIGKIKNKTIEYDPQQSNIKLCYSGRLDPMARGKVLILFNDECKKVESYNKKAKTYQFEIIIGLQTNSDDPLGIIENIKIGGKYISIEKVKYIQKFIEQYLDKLFNIDSFYQSIDILLSFEL